MQLTKLIVKFALSGLKRSSNTRLFLPLQGVREQLNLEVEPSWIGQQTSRHDSAEAPYRYLTISSYQISYKNQCTIFFRYGVLHTPNAKGEETLEVIILIVIREPDDLDIDSIIAA